MDKNINFPHLGIYLDNVGKNLSVFGFEIAYYGITIAVAMLAGMWLAMRVAKKTNQNPDTYFDMGMIAIVCALIGARAFYVIFAWDTYRNDLLSIFNFRQYLPAAKTSASLPWQIHRPQSEQLSLLRKSPVPPA